MINDNLKYGRNTIIKEIRTDNRLWKLSEKREKCGKKLYSTKCRCDAIITARSYRVKSHGGYCRKCTPSLSKTRRKMSKLYRERARKKFMKENKQKQLGELIIKFDNQMDNTVRAFNLIFDGIIGGDQNDIIEIGLPYTHKGRILTRINSLGIANEVRYLFNNDEDRQGSDKNIVYDVYDLKGNFLESYKSISKIAREYMVEDSTIANIMYDRVKSNLNIDVKERTLTNKDK